VYADAPCDQVLQFIGGHLRTEEFHFDPLWYRKRPAFLMQIK
jgi:hypothetical protein